MKIFDLYSKRQADAAKSGAADVYQYETIPENLRVQVKQIALEAIGQVCLPDGSENSLWVTIESVFCREKGCDRIASGMRAGSRVLTFMHACPIADWLDLLELIAVGIKAMASDEFAAECVSWNVSTPGQPAIDEINYRLREAGVGYQLEGARLIRVDSQYLHAEVVKPALILLSGEGFEGPRQEFLKAHRFFQAGEHRQAVGSAANAVESSFKAIYDQKGWAYPKGARISDLIKVAKKHNLWPDYLDTSFDQLAATLQSGLPKIRDNDAAHGQGATPKNVPGYIAAYALHLAASKILFITEAAK